MTAYVALLRGINVGGKNKLPMQDLARVFRDAGCERVETYIQSGNVVFRVATTRTRTLAAQIEQAILTEHGLTVPVILRSRAELAACIARNPFVAQGVDPDRLHVAFLATDPSASAVAALDPLRSPPDAFAVIGREVYLHLPNGAGRTKITNAWLDTRLATISTMRNWRTVQTLGAMVDKP